MEGTIGDKRAQLAKMEESYRVTEEAKEKINEKLALNREMLGDIAAMVGSLVGHLKCDTYVIKYPI